VTVTVEQHHQLHLEQLHQLVNCHLDGVVPGWRLPSGVIADSLEPAPLSRTLDPWVAERRTLCAMDGDRLLGAAHVLRYGAGPEVDATFRGAAELAWLLFWPRTEAASQALVGAVRGLAAGWRASRMYACGTSLPVPVVSGVPESWPHVAVALRRAGFQPQPTVEEVLYGGRLPDVAPAEPPLRGLEVRVAPEEPGTRFRAEVDGVEIGVVEWSPNLSFGGTLPALAGWAELRTLVVRDGWRGLGVGTWLVGRTVPFLRLVGVSRVVAALTARDEAEGAGSLCRRLGWEPVVRVEQGWSAPA
jgi:GNAT superfamily N-acetyltransferase